jgi:hypothetical protein
MRYLIVIAILLVISTALYGTEISVGLDRCVVLNHPINQLAESMAAIYFEIPDSLSGKEIIYVEIDFPFSIQGLNDSSLYEFMLYPATGEWSEEAIDYNQAVNLADSLMTGAYTIRLTDQSEFHIDITDFVSEVVKGNEINYGLIAFADLLGDNNLRLPENLGDVISNNGGVRIVYK